MQEEKLSWSKGFALVCSKCSERKNGVPPTCSAEVRDFLKDAFKKSNQWGQVRVMSSSCLGLCPDGKLALSIHREGGDSKMLSVESLEDKDLLLSQVHEEIF